MLADLKNGARGCACIGGVQILDGWGGASPVRDPDALSRSQRRRLVNSPLIPVTMVKACEAIKAIPAAPQKDNEQRFNGLHAISFLDKEPPGEPGGERWNGGSVEVGRHGRFDTQCLRQHEGVEGDLLLVVIAYHLALHVIVGRFGGTKLR